MCGTADNALTCEVCGVTVIGAGYWRNGECFCADCFDREVGGPSCNRGWQCPACLVVHAPSVLRCECAVPRRATRLSDLPARVIDNSTHTTEAQ